MVRQILTATLGKILPQRDGNGTEPCLGIKTVSAKIGISIIKIKRLRDGLIFIMEIPTLVRNHIDTETTQGFLLLTWINFDPS